MDMVKRISITLYVWIATILIFAGGVAARAAYTLPDPGYTPESRLWGFEVFWDRLTTLFTFGADEKVKQVLFIASKRLSEARALAGKNPEGTARAFELYAGEMSVAYAAATRGGDTARIGLVGLATNDHFPFLDEVSERMPPEYKPASRRIKEFTIDDQTGAITALFSQDPIEALTVFLPAIEGRLKRIEAVARDAQNNEEALREYEKYALFAKGLIAKTTPVSVNGASVSDLIRTQTKDHDSRLQALYPKLNPQALGQFLRARNSIRALQGLSTLISG